MHRVLSRFLTPSLAACLLIALAPGARAQEADDFSGAFQSPDSVVDAGTVVELHTSKGVIAIALDVPNAPFEAANFLQYVRSGHYDGTIFHRVIPGFMIEAGGHAADMAEKSMRAPVKNESENGLKNVRGTVAMARKNDPDSATARFFVILVDDGALDDPSYGGYTVFGKVVQGMEVVDAIAQAPTGTPRDGHENVPTTPIVIIKAAIRP